MEIIKKHKNIIWMVIFTIVTAFLFSTVNLMTDRIKVLEVLSRFSSGRIFSPVYLRSVLNIILYITISEEIIFRGAVLKLLEKRVRYANVVQAILYALFHFYFVRGNIYMVRGTTYMDIVTVFVPCVFMGMFYGYLKDRTGRIDVSIIFHILYFSSFFYLSNFYIKVSVDSVEKLSDMTITGYDTLGYPLIIIIVLWIFVTVMMIKTEKESIFEGRKTNEG